MGRPLESRAGVVARGQALTAGITMNRMDGW